MTADEVSAAWPSVEDATESQEGLLKNIRAMRQTRTNYRNDNDDDDDDDICSRGLEKMQSAEKLGQRKLMKERVVDAVLDEQDLQEEAGIYDDAALGEASMCNSRWARDKARTMGESDAAYVRRSRRLDTKRLKSPLQRRGDDEACCSNLENVLQDVRDAGIDVDPVEPSSPKGLSSKVSKGMRGHDIPSREAKSDILKRAANIDTIAPPAFPCTYNLLQRMTVLER